MLYPMGIWMFLTALGIVWSRRRPNGHVGWLLMLTASIWLLVMAMPVTGLALLRHLELQAGTYADSAVLSRSGVRNIVVLGGDLRHGKLSPADRIAYTSLVRLMEGIRIWKEMPGSRLVLSGGGYSDASSSGEGMAVLARVLNVPDNAIVVENKSLDTEDEARQLKSLLSDRPFALVTSASHMRRSLKSFRRMGLAPIPAPADFQSQYEGMDFNMFLPSANGLAEAQKAVHEYLGLLFLWIKGG